MNLLLSNWHETHGQAIVDDFKAVGWNVYAPITDWGHIGYYQDNRRLRGAKLITLQEWIDLDNRHIMCGCTEQMHDMARLADITNSKLMYTVSKNNAEYPHNSDFLLSPDIQTFNNYPAKYSMLYFYEPRVLNIPKDFRLSMGRNKIKTYIHKYSQHWKEGYAELEKFEKIYGKEVEIYGKDNRNGVLPLGEVHRHMSESFFTLYFKEKESYGSMAIESMMLGTPLIALKKFIYDKSISMFVDESNSILGQTVEECVEKINNLKIQDYINLSQNAKKTAKINTDKKRRREELKRLLDMYTMQA